MRAVLCLIVVQISVQLGLGPLRRGQVLIERRGGRGVEAVALIEAAGSLTVLRPVAYGIVSQRVVASELTKDCAKGR